MQEGPARCKSLFLAIFSVCFLSFSSRKRSGTNSDNNKIKSDFHFQLPFEKHKELGGTKEKDLSGPRARPHIRESIQTQNCTTSSTLSKRRGEELKVFLCTLVNLHVFHSFWSFHGYIWCLIPCYDPKSYICLWNGKTVTTPCNICIFVSEFLQWEECISELGTFDRKKRCMNRNTFSLYDVPVTLQNWSFAYSGLKRQFLLFEIFLQVSNSSICTAVPSIPVRNRQVK